MKNIFMGNLFFVSENFDEDEVTIHEVDEYSGGESILKMVVFHIFMEAE